MKKRITSLLLVAVMLLTFLPLNVIAATISYNPNGYRNSTITVVDENRNRISNATVTVTRGNNSYEVKNIGNGQYKFTRDSTLFSASYTVIISADGYETQSGTMSGSTSNATFTLVEEELQFATFGVYYYIDDGIIPPTGYAGSNDPVYYGPSANDTPLVNITVNVSLLKEIANAPNSPVVYRENTSSNQYEFVPVGTPDDDDFLQNIRAFWDAALTCIDEASSVAFIETGLYEEFQGYCIKKQNGGSFHIDGILSVVPPVYVVELYQNGVYFGGTITDQSEQNGIFPTAYDILDQYEAHLKQNITWYEDENGKPKLNAANQYVGTYVDTKTNRINEIQIYQTDIRGYEVVNVEGSEFTYVKRTDIYYLAKFEMTVIEGEEIEYLVTYTDGIDTESVFNPHEYKASKNDVVPPFTGSTNWNHYKFVGWVLEGDSTGKVYTDADIALMTVNSNMTFHAVWEAVPEYVGTVKIVLNGTVDAVTGSLTSGELIDLSTILKNENVGVYVSADDQSYIKLDRQDVGVYSSVLQNGIYQMYYSFDGVKFERGCPQYLDIDDQSRTRILFYYSVDYDPNGGKLNGSGDTVREYYHSTHEAFTLPNAPEREGFIFAGWEDENGNIYRENSLITSAIAKPYVLKAKWIESADVFVHVTLKHGENDSDLMHNINFTLDTREGHSGDYTEIFRKSIYWDGVSDYDDVDYEYSYNGERTDYESIVPVLKNVPKNNDYTFTTSKLNYVVESVITATDENGDIHIHAILSFNPEIFEFDYTVELDEEAKKLDKSLWPSAVNVKVTTYYNPENSFGWYPINEYSDTYERISLDENGFGEGRFSVWAHDDSHESYRYRIEVVSYELSDGTIIPAVDKDGLHETYYSAHKRFFADIEVEGGKAPKEDADELSGAWYDHETHSQNGTVKAIVRIPTYTVILDPNGGILNETEQNTVLEKQIIVPDLAPFVPQREGGYTFLGWYLADENGNMTETKVVSGSDLVSDITLIAKWSAPINIEGTVFVDCTYISVNGELFEIPVDDRVLSVTVLLQKHDANGYYKTIGHSILSIEYREGEKQGFADYNFENIPNDGSEYRIEVISSNYTAKYQNEPESLDGAKKNDFSVYNETSYNALLGETDIDTATVNSVLNFTPSFFDLDFKVDSSRIEESFRPDDAEILITYEGDPSIIETHKWPVITQMTNGNETDGIVIPFEQNGLGFDSYPVWQTTYNGTRECNYGLCVKNIDGVAFVENPYYGIIYDAPAHYHEATGEQSKLLVATLVPKTYDIIYNTNGGTIFGAYTSTHTWSYETALSEVVPVKIGYQFDGWYTDEALTIPLTAESIDASVAEDVNFYAKWIQVNVNVLVVIDHTTDDGGISSNYEKKLELNLLSRDSDSNGDFIPVDGMTREYDSDIWHTRGDTVNDDTLEVDSIFTNLSKDLDYNISAFLDGYYVVESCSVDSLDDGENEIFYTGVEKVENTENGTTTVDHNVVICLKYNPDMLNLEFSVEMADGVEKSLYPKSAEMKVTCWYVDPETEAHDWGIITQHSEKVVEVTLDPENGNGFGSGHYPVWQWQNKGYGVPYYYRVEVVGLKLADDSYIALNETVDEEVYSNGGYKATVFAENGCTVPVDVDDDGNKSNANTELLGAFGVPAENGRFEQQGTLKVVIDIGGKVVFHANNENATCYDSASDNEVFRTYYRADAKLPEGEYYRLGEDGRIAKFYDIPEFDYYTHNNYIFKGWYDSPDEDANPIDLNAAYLTENSEDVHIYAHWITVGEVEKEESDNKITGTSSYNGFDLIGVQIRSEELDDIPHHGGDYLGTGLRFLTVLSESVYAEINALRGNEGGAEYGFVMAKTDTAKKYANGKEDYELEYKSDNTNGVNTSADYKYVQNAVCNGVADHYQGSGYRIYTTVITYNGLSGSALSNAQSTEFVARSYIRYYDANGLERVHYNNYTGRELYSGCTVSYTGADNLLTANGENV